MSTTVQKSDQCAGSDKRSRGRSQHEHHATARLKKSTSEATMDITVPLRTITMFRFVHKKYCACHKKMKLRHPKSCTCHDKMTSTCSLEKWRQSHKTNSRLSQHRPSQPNVAPDTKLAAPRIVTHACQCFSNVSDVLRLPHKTKLWPSKTAKSLAPAHKRQIAPKTDTARSREHKDFLQKRKNQELLSCKGHQKRRTCMCEPSINQP